MRHYNIVIMRHSDTVSMDMYVCMYGWMDGWMDGGREGGRERGREGGREGGRDGRMDGWMDGWMYACINAVRSGCFVSLFLLEDVKDLLRSKW